MPIYEYQCGSCGHQLEAFQKVSDPQLSKCPECGKSSLKKQVSAAAFQLKGGGWYVTDFRNKDKGKPKSAEEADAKTEKTAEGKEKSDSKTDTKKPKAPSGDAKKSTEN